MPGFTGDLCAIDIDECQSDPCLNQGICIDEINGFTCNCSQGFIGVQCELSTENCSTVLGCQNDGTCTRSISI